MPLFPKRRAADFLRDEDGSIVVEVAFVVPAMFIAMLALFCAFDAFRQNAVNQKAAYTIGDLISRQTTPVDQTFLSGTQALFDYLTRSNENSIRITSVQWDAEAEEFKLDWTRGTGSFDKVPAAVDTWTEKLPNLAPDEHITVVETISIYNAPFRWGLKGFEMENFVFTRPRYAPAVHWGNG